MVIRKVFYIVIIATATLVLVSLGYGCHPVLQAGQPEAPPQASVSQVLSMPADSLDIAYQGLAWKTIRTFYEGRQQRLFWTDGSFSTLADTLSAFIENIRYYGLLPANYHLGELKALNDRFQSSQKILRREALLTDAFLTVVKDLQVGRLKAKTPATDSVALALLNGVVRHGGVVKQITSGEPVNREYRLIKNACKVLLDTLPPAERQAALANSGLLSPAVNESITTIEINLERQRAWRITPGRRYILVNIPSFMLQVVEDDSVILESKVIVGKPENPTPELSSSIECFITYPYWHVPRKIAVEEYLPLMQEDTAFIHRNNFDVLDRKGNLLDPDGIDWKKFSSNYFPFSLRQREGTDNSLGVVKFVFDNPYAVFLHDTNAKRLFRSNIRAFSHGCIRMEKAIVLAHYLVTGSVTGRSKYLDRYLKQELRHTVNLPAAIPIHVRYWTCDAGEGSLRIYKDLYGRDEALRARLYGASNDDGL